MKNQGQIFYRSEGDRWFTRNKEAIQSKTEADMHISMMSSYGISPRRVMEIGAANGYRLDAIHRKFGSDVWAVEPSRKAIADGRRRFPRISFVRALSHEVPLRMTFDCIIIHFVFHWVDRSNLLRSVSEIDRLLGDKGFLFVGDFYPSNFLRVRYHHLPEKDVYTYKQNYSSIFLASGIYRCVAGLTMDHSSHLMRPITHENERAAIWLLQKDLTGVYADAGRKGE